MDSGWGRMNNNKIQRCIFSIGFNVKSQRMSSATLISEAIPLFWHSFSTTVLYNDMQYQPNFVEILSQDKYY